MSDPTGRNTPTSWHKTETQKQPEESFALRQARELAAAAENRRKQKCAPANVRAKKETAREKEARETMSEAIRLLSDAVNADAAAGQGFQALFDKSLDKTDEGLAKAFGEIDTDGGGTLDLGEMKEYITKTYLNITGRKIDQKLVNEMMNAADTDGDGEVDFEEFKVIMRAGLAGGDGGNSGNSGGGAAFADALSLLCDHVRNIVSSPSDLMLRSIKKGKRNPRFHAALGRHAAARELLRLLGFRYQDEEYEPILDADGEPIFLLAPDADLAPLKVPPTLISNISRRKRERSRTC